MPNGRNNPQQNLIPIPGDLSNVSAVNIDKISNERGKLFNEKKIRTNQIRNFYSKVISIRNDFREKKNLDENLTKSLIMLKPAIAYAAGRQTSVKEFQKFIFDCVDGVINSKDRNKAMENFLNLIEGVVAYHKFYGD
jgi:CRISPR-associated protein Csm2